jgi:hypothetical protein
MTTPGRSFTRLHIISKKNYLVLPGLVPTLSEILVVLCKILTSRPESPVLVPDLQAI